MPNHFMKLWKRGLALLLAGVLLFSNLSGSLAFAESTLSQETTEATAETAETADTASLSEQAQAFVDAVKALDRDSMVAASNDWGLAHQAWMADLDNAVLESKLNEAIAVQEEACAPLYAAEDLYNQIPEAERSDDRVQDAYAVWAAILAATYAVMENPVASGAGGEPDLAEITEMLYDDLPDAPTGSYIGSMGLPIATGQTRISISEWVTDLYDGVDAHINAEALHADDLVITVDREPGEEYAIVPLMVQVEYPANGSTSEILLPEDVVLLDFEGNPADADEIASITKASYTETSATASGFYVKAKQDFSVEFVYQGPDGSELRKTLQVKLGESKAAAKVAANAGASTYAAGPTPPFTTGKITSISFEGGTWLIWFNGIEAYCCSHGLNGQPNGCPTYNFSYVSKLEPGQYTPGNHYANQVNIWGGLGQLSLNLLEEKHSGTSASTYGLESESAEAAAYRYYDDVQLWIMANYPDSLAAQTYRASAQALAEQGTENRAATYSGENGYYTYIYNPPAGYAWQIVAIVGEEISEGGGTDIPDVPDTEYYSANWTAPAQSASGSFNLTFTVNADKQQLETGEKVDGAKITVTPSKTSGSIDGGSWQMSPAGAQTITTSGHTNDDNYQNNGGDGTVSWTVHYEVSKTSTTTLSGQEGPFSSQAEADAAAEAAKNAAISQLKNEAQGMVDAAIAAARAELATIRFSYDEVEIPYGFEEFNGSLGSHQTITVPADSSNDYVMKNDEWSLQVNLKKVDSETGEQITGDALYEVYEWDTVTQQYIPFGGYNQYTVVRNEDGTYSVANGTDYGTEYDTSRKMYYTQRNEGKFIIVETRAPSGYYGDWTDVKHPGTAGTPLGKRGYYIEITRANDGSVITLDNTHYSADIATSYTGGTKLLTSGGVETTVTIYKASDEPAAEIQYQEAGRVYNTDNSGTAANEDSYTMTPKEGVMQNDRSLGEISISKVDLDAVRYVGGRDTDGDAMASGQAHADARLDGAVYDLYAAEDIQHPDGVTGTVDYSKITYADGTPIWHTTIRDNSGQWVDDYLPVLTKDHLVASAVIKDGWLTFSNLYLGKYYIVERGTGVVIPVEDGAYKLSGTYPDVDGKTKEPTGTTSQLATNSAGQYTDYVYKHQWSYIGQSKALDGTKTYDGYYESYATGYLCDEHNYDMELQRKETKEMLDDLTTRDQRMMFGLVTLVHMADTKEKLDDDTESLLSVARKHLCQLSTLRWQQRDGLDTVLPYGLRRIEALRTLTTESTAVLIPFRAQEIMQQKGMYYGQNAVSKNRIVVDRRQLLNGNSFRLGVSGSGKSMSAKEEIAQIALSTEDDILILDVESEFGHLVEAFGGEVIRISATSDTHINALDMDRAYGDERNPIVSKSEFVLSLFEQLIGSGLVTAKEKSILGRCTEQVYMPYVRNGYKGAVPTLKDFYRLLKMQPEPEAQGLALSSELFITGTLGTFAQPTNVDTKARIIAYDIRELGEQLMPLGMLVTLDAIYNRVIQNWKRGHRTWIFCDEFYRARRSAA